MQENHLQHLITDLFPNHSICWNQRVDIIFLHALGDSLTMLAYYLIPVTLAVILYRYRFGKQLKRVFGIYGTFILLCGTTHLLDVVMIWRVNEEILIVDGWLRVATGVFSMFSWVVTAYAAVHFRRTFDELLLIKAEMEKERENFYQVSKQLTARWKAFSETVEGFLSTPDK